uniref:ZSWIM8 TPR repeats domain-containing protein n=1 Tax=Eptatretus burgeri TaxID=7764 RepID=A0A8C4R145_EPTBU
MMPNSWLFVSTCLILQVSLLTTVVSLVTSTLPVIIAVRTASTLPLNSVISSSTILPTAQRLLDELLSSQSTAINTMCGAPDPTAGPSASDQSTWYLDEDTLSDNIKKTLHKFCGPSPIVFSDVNSLYLSSTEPPAAAEWACLLRPLRGREPEGIWNLLSIVREMFRRRDTNAVPLLEILTDLCLACEQIAAWWYNVRTSPSHSSASGHATRHSGGGGGGQSEVAAHACASMCDEIVALWRLAVLDPAINAPRSSEIVERLRQWHLRVLEVARRGQSRKNLGRLFLGFKPAIEACFIDWGQACPIPGITNCSNPVGGAPDKRLGCGRPSSVGHVTVPSRKTRPGDSCLKTKEECGRRKPGVVVTDGSGHGGRIEEKGVGAAKSGSLAWGVKQGSSCTKAGAGGTRGSSRVRLSSEEEVDSSLEPDMADLRLEEGGLALGAEASNAFCVEPGTLHKGQMELDVPAAKGLWAKGSSLDGEAVDPAERFVSQSYIIITLVMLVCLYAHIILEKLFLTFKIDD